MTVPTLHHVVLMVVGAHAFPLLHLFPINMDLHTSMVPPTTIPSQFQPLLSSRLTCTCSNQAHPFSHYITSWSKQDLLTNPYTKHFPSKPSLPLHLLTTSHLRGHTPFIPTTRAATHTNYMVLVTATKTYHMSTILITLTRLPTNTLLPLAKRDLLTPPPP